MAEALRGPALAWERRRERYGPSGCKAEPTVRFWAKVDRSGGPFACWPWTAGRTARRPTRVGYGTTYADGHVQYAHRVAYAVAVGPIPPGALILHSCDNGLCCNPAHLRTGTALDNTRDMVSRGRARGQPKKTHCPQGHPYDENTYHSRGSGRMCRKCMQDRKRRRREI